MLPKLVRMTTRKLGFHRNAPRFYADSAYLLSAKFAPGSTVEVEFGDGSVTIRLCASPRGKAYTVSSKKGGAIPVIDVNARGLWDALGKVECVRVEVREGLIVLTPAATELLRRTRCRNGRSGDLFVGGGFFTRAAKRAGFKPAWGVELVEKYADVFAENFPEAVTYSMDIAEVPVRELTPVELISVSLTCDLFTNLRNVNRGTRQKRNRAQVPEAQGADSALVFWVAMIVHHCNPATVVFEQAREWRDSASGHMMKFFLERLGYTVEAREVDATEYGELQMRRRTVMVATSDGEVRWPVKSQTERTLGDIFDPDELVEGEWFTRESKAWLFRHWEQQRLKGNGFEGVKVTAESTHVKSITKTYAAQSGDGTVVQHPTDPGRFRWFTLSEIRKLFGVPADHVLNVARTVAVELMGQGVIVPLFQSIIEAATGRAAVYERGRTAQENGAEPPPPPMFAGAEQLGFAY